MSVHVHSLSSSRGSIRTAGAIAALAVVIAACSTSSDNASCSTPGGPVSGAADTHCSGDAGPIVVTVDPAACTADAGAADPDAGATGDYGDTMFNQEGDDDDCKYHVKWSSSPVCENADVTFTVTATTKVDGTPLTDANPDLEVFLNDTHPAPNSSPHATETSPGVYTVGPIRFDKPGQWTVRFHFREECTDTEDSPHGHAAFYVSVP